MAPAIFVATKPQSFWSNWQPPVESNNRDALVQRWRRASAAGSSACAKQKIAGAEVNAKIIWQKIRSDLDKKLTNLEHQGNPEQQLGAQNAGPDQPNTQNAENGQPRTQNAEPNQLGAQNSEQQVLNGGAPEQLNAEVTNFEHQRNPEQQPGAQNAGPDQPNTQNAENGQPRTQNAEPNQLGAQNSEQQLLNGGAPEQLNAEATYTLAQLTWVCNALSLYGSNYGSNILSTTKSPHVWKWQALAQMETFVFRAETYQSRLETKQLTAASVARQISEMTLLAKTHSTAFAQLTAQIAANKVDVEHQIAEMEAQQIKAFEHSATLQKNIWDHYKGVTEQVQNLIEQSTLELEQIRAVAAVKKND